MTFEIPAKQGWQCPLCKIIHAPDVLQCYCNNKPAESLPSLILPSDASTPWNKDLYGLVTPAWSGEKTSEPKLCSCAPKDKFVIPERGTQPGDR